MRRACAAALAIVVAASVARAADEVTVGIAIPRTQVVVGESFEVELQIGVRRDFLEKSAIQPFRVELDVPVAVESPFAELPPGLVAIDGPPVEEGPTLALDGEVVHARSGAQPGDPYVRLSIVRHFRATRPGELTFVAAAARYAYATRFQDDFVLGRVPLDRHDVRVACDPLTVEARAIPTEGRPSGYAGAIGRFELSAETSATSIAVGESVAMTVRIEGRGNLEDFDIPRYTPAGWHVVGVIDDRGAARRTLTYELEALDAGVTRLPSLALVSFDPEAGRFETAKTAPLEITVRLPSGEVPPPRDAAAPDGDAPGWPRSLLWLLPLVLVLTWLGRRMALRRRPAGPPSPLDQALAALDATQGDTGAAADALAGYVAGRLECPAAAVITPDLPARLVRAGVARDLADRTSAALESLIAARYGADGAPSSPNIAALLRDLDAAWPD